MSDVTRDANEWILTILRNIIGQLLPIMWYQWLSLSNKTFFRRLSRAAKEGVTLSQYYVQQVCTPSRSALMTGKHTTLSFNHGCSERMWSQLRSTKFTYWNESSHWPTQCSTAKATSLHMTPRLLQIRSLHKIPNANTLYMIRYVPLPYRQTERHHQTKAANRSYIEQNFVVWKATGAGLLYTHCWKVASR